MRRANLLRFRRGTIIQEAVAKGYHIRRRLTLTDAVRILRDHWSCPVKRPSRSCRGGRPWFDSTPPGRDRLIREELPLVGRLHHQLAKAAHAQACLNQLPRNSHRRASSAREVRNLPWATGPLTSLEGYSDSVGAPTGAARAPTEREFRGLRGGAQLLQNLLIHLAKIIRLPPSRVGS